ncbi:MAG: VacB/RNase II family 3'-5' exoribonuclease, partial [Deltaproteobacteria bacterium]|nr:VacB/RNase II family 3'-5' exoribonuclease [Deltaproteobacteria bacterium]
MGKKNSPAGDARDGGPGTFRDEPLSPELLERVLREVRKPLRLDDFLRILAVRRRAKKALEGCLQDLTATGRALRLPGGTYALAAVLKTLTGVLAVQRSGVGFVKLDPPAKGEAFIGGRHFGGAWPGDRVEIVLLPDKRGKNREGRVVRVLERALKELVVRVARIARDGCIVCEPADPRVPAMFLVDGFAPHTAPARHSLLRVRPGEAREPGLWTAALVETLGDEKDASVQEELVKANHAVPRAFPPDALAEAAAFPPDPDRGSLAGRRDLGELPFVTIDGASARDFDDAVHVEKTRRGYTLYVAIADVAHYVRPGSALDDEALLRGNSYYFPRSVEPMLPEALSNGLCSLNPGVPRLAMVAEMTIAADGAPCGERFYPARIVSGARLTYDQVRDGLLNGEEAARKSMAGSLPMLERALELARLLADARRRRGSLDFELPEPECVFDAGGRLLSLVPREHHFAHKLIEEFMVAANEAVARFLTARGVPLLYRVHPSPDPEKLQNLFATLAMTGLGMTGLTADGARKGRKDAPSSPKALQAALDKAKGTPHEYLVSRVALRSMMQANYSPDLEGHFGLASDCYCHFTSPIRRYADLVVHRALKAALDESKRPSLPGVQRLRSVADQINAAERVAMEAEREIYRRLSVTLMADHVGETYAGVVSGLTEFGIFVELASVMAEGMVRLAELSDD